MQSGKDLTVRDRSFSRVAEECDENEEPEAPFIPNQFLEVAEELNKPLERTVIQNGIGAVHVAHSHLLQGFGLQVFE